MSPAVSGSGEFVEAAAALVRQRTGLCFGESRRSALETGLAAAMRRASITQWPAYLDRIETEPALLDDLVAEITIGETYFFRDPQQFDLLRNRVLPELRSRRPPGHALRIWSAGCATGEEPYTLAIVTGELRLDPAPHIVATDLSRTALANARRAVYTRWALRGVPDGVVHAYFEQTGDRFALAPGVRDAVDFRYLNLAGDTYPSLATGIWGMDLILCRNVLIYFDHATVTKVARRLIDSLSEDGLLLLGASDPPLGTLVACEIVVTDAGLAYRRSGRGATGAVSIAAPVRSAGPPPLSEARPPEPVPPPAVRASLPDAAVVLGDQGSAGPVEVVRLYAERDYEGAADLAGRLLERDGGDPVLWIVRVRALANCGLLEASGQACAAGLDRHRGSAELMYLHAVLLGEAGRHEEAANAARRALYLDRHLVVAHLALGGALARLGNTDGASRAFRNAERLLTALSPEAIVPASDGEPAGRLAEMARVQVQLQRGAA